MSNRTGPPRSPRWWRTATSLGLLLVIALLIVVTALVADRSGVEICGRNTPCSDGTASATMIGVALIAIVVIILACAVVVFGSRLLERRLFSRRTRGPRQPS